MLCSDMFDVVIVIVIDNYECKALCELHLNRIWFFIYNAYGHMTGIGFQTNRDKYKNDLTRWFETTVKLFPIWNIHRGVLTWICDVSPIPRRK